MATHDAPLPVVDEDKLEALVGTFVSELGAVATTALVLIGDKLGLYRAMADSSPVTPAELAERTGTRERYVREWLCQQAASGDVTYDPPAGTFRLPPEQAMALADEDSPVFMPGAFQLAAAMIKDEPHITERFRTGAGFGWHEHHRDRFEAPSASSARAGAAHRGARGGRLQPRPARGRDAVQHGAGGAQVAGAARQGQAVAGCLRASRRSVRRRRRTPLRPTASSSP